MRVENWAVTLVGEDDTQFYLSMDDYGVTASHVGGKPLGPRAKVFGSPSEAFKFLSEWYVHPSSVCKPKEYRIVKVSPLFESLTGWKEVS